MSLRKSFVCPSVMSLSTSNKSAFSTYLSWLSRVSLSSPSSSIQNFHAVVSSGSLRLGQADVAEKHDEA
ncbi:hypothetical protein ACFX13_032523 [Malus domestica]